MAINVYLVQWIIIQSEPAPLTDNHLCNSQMPGLFCDGEDPVSA